MAQISKYRLSEKEEAEIKSLLNQIFAALYDRQDVADFLGEFLTPTERIVLSKRIAIALLLKKNFQYEAVMRLLKVSAPTVADVSLKLKYAGQGYHRILDKILKEKSINQFFSKIEDVALVALTIGHGKGTGIYFKRKIKKQQSKTKII